MPDGAPFELLRSLGVLAEPPAETHAALLDALDLPAAASVGAYADVFAFQLYPYASVYLGGEGMLGGEARDRVAGLWRALGQSPPAEPDHLAALLGLYAQIAEVMPSAPDAERALLVEGQRTVLAEQLAPWLFAWLERVGSLAPEPYRSWSVVLADVLSAEATRLEISSLDVPAALAEVPLVRDPRDEGSESFLRDLLAYARSGLVLTRADLAAVAAELDIGLRAGERRYALEHLLAQDADAVLSALADVATVQAGGHRDRVPRLGATAAHYADRADRTAGLLRALARTATESAGTVS